jgi:hypothetical protein
MFILAAVFAAVLMAVVVTAAATLSAAALVLAVLVGFRPCHARCSKQLRPAAPDEEHHCAKRKPCGSRKDPFMLAFPMRRDF